jgi:haloalkane dehalogenase
MGFGKSEAPENRTYWLQDHIDNIEKLVLALDLQQITLVIHDFGGPVGMGLAARHPGRIARIVSINGPTPFGQPDLEQRFMANIDESPWFQWILSAEKLGKLETVLHEIRYNILSTLKLNGFENHGIITDHWLEAYRAPFNMPADCRGVIGWAKGLATNRHIFETPSPYAKNIIGALPSLAIWGMADKTLHGKHFLPLFRQVFSNGQIYELPGTGHYSLEDDPVTICLLVKQFLALTSSVIKPIEVR